MRISVPTKGLLEGLDYLIPVLPGKTSKPILQCIRIVILPESIHLEGTDLETSFRWVVQGIIPFELLVEEKPIVEIDSIK